MGTLKRKSLKRSLRNKRRIVSLYHPDPFAFYNYKIKIINSYWDNDMLIFDFAIGIPFYFEGSFPGKEIPIEFKENEEYHKASLDFSIFPWFPVPTQRYKNYDFSLEIHERSKLINKNIELNINDKSPYILRGNGPGNIDIPVSENKYNPFLPKPIVSHLRGHTKIIIGSGG